MDNQLNRRGYRGHIFNRQHLKLNDLKVRCFENSYLFKENIPLYPRPEFHVTHLKHDTAGAGLLGIRQDNGFCVPSPEGPLRMLWWSLMIRPEDIQSAEKRLLEEIYPDRMEEQAQKQQSFLGKFATSPAFLNSSRLGPYRFTFPLEELLKAYSQQFCSSAQPVMRVLKTVLYKQEVMYTVLVHSPDNQELFSEYPLLTDDPNAVCAYRDGRFIWRPEAMCETHSYELVLRRDENQVEAKKVFGNSSQYYVWDNVAVTLHVEDGQVLKFDADRLRENLTYCQKGKPLIIPHDEFHDFDKATDFVKELWPDYLSPLKPSLNIHAS